MGPTKTDPRRSPAPLLDRCKLRRLPCDCGGAGRDHLHRDHRRV